MTQGITSSPTISRDAIFQAAQSGRGTEALSIARAYAPLKQDEEGWYLLATLESAHGTLAGMERALTKVLEVAPQNREARYNLGVVLQQQHRSVEAISHYQLVLKNGAYPEAKCNLGLLYLETGESNLAVSTLEDVVRESPSLAEGVLNLGLAYLQVGRAVDAERNLLRAVELDPANGRAWHSLGLCAEARNDEKAAIDAYMRGIHYAPQFTDSHLRLGRIAAAQGDVNAAKKLYEDALKASPDFYDLYLALGHLLSQVAANGGDYAEAYRVYEKAEKLQPNDARLHYAFGWLKFSEGKTAEAIARYQQALAVDPTYQDAMAGYATVLEREGRFDEAREILQPALFAEHPHSLVLLAESQLAKTPEQKQQSVARMRARVVSETNRHWQCDLYFALGKLQDELKQYDAAFADFVAGNELERRPFDAAANANLFRRIEVVYHKDKWASLPKSTNPSPLPIFIVGMPRSGTSLVEQILASHPNVFGGGELTAINHLMTHFDRYAGVQAFPEGAAAVTVSMLETLGANHLSHLAHLAHIAQLSGDSGNVTRVTDKMPHNFICLGLIAQMLPGARIIHCQRDPVDTCLSVYFQHFNTHHAYASDLSALGEYFKQYEALMAHWRETLTIPILEIRYEDLVADQEAWSRRLIEFVDLPWDDACLSFFNAKRTVNTPSYDQVRRPMYTQSVQRWKYYEKHLQPLLAALGMQNK